MGLKHWTGKTLGQQLNETAAKFPDHEAMVFMERRITYREFLNVTNLLAKGLLRLGVKKGEGIALWMTNYPEWVFTFMAAVKIGTPLITVNTRYKTKEAEYIIGQSQASTVVIMDQFFSINYLDMMYEMCPELRTSEPGKLVSKALPKLKNVICLGKEKHKGTFGFNEILELGKSYGDDELRSREESVKCSDPVLMVYTSGTTGNPKGAMHNHNILRHEYDISNWRHITEHDRFIAYLPFFHIAGSCSIVISAIICGACMVLMERWNTEEGMRLIEKEKCTILDGIPTHFIDIVNHPKFSQYDLSSVRVGWIGGAPVPEETVKQILSKIDMALVKVYGMAETTSVTTFTKMGDSAETLAHTDGLPISDGFEVRITDLQTGEALPPEKEGEICVRGYLVMMEYYNMPEENAKCFDKDGWFHTEDLAVMHENGYISITGRLTDMFIVGGTNAYPAEIEDVIANNPKVKQVYVVGVPDNRLGEVCMACVELKAGEEATDEEIINFCRDKLADYKVPRYVKFMTEFPQTPTGKVQKFKLREMGLEKYGLKSS